MPLRDCWPGWARHCRFDVSALRRLFLAAWPNAAVRAQLAVLVEQCAACGHGRAIPAENLHLTLAFLGDQPEQRVAEIVALAETLEPAPVQMQLDRFGHFHGPQILWVGPSITPVPLQAFQSLLARRLSEQGVAVDQRSYRPHVSLLRKVSELIDLPIVQPMEWALDHWALLESPRTAGGAHYQVLAEWPWPQSPES
jgi:2'-5' RNA ligase